MEHQTPKTFLMITHFTNYKNRCTQ